MKTKLFLLLLVGFIFSNLNAQVNGSPIITVGPDIVLPCNTPCVDLSASLLDVGSTSSYSVSSIPYSPPLAYNATGGNPVLTSGDDRWSDVIPLPFPFCFYGDTYNELKIGTNGAIKLGPTPLSNGGNHPWSFNSSVPSPNLVDGGNIYGAYQDLAPSLFQGVVPGLLLGSINWFVQGTAPNRSFIVIYNNTPLYVCLNLTSSTMIVMHENSNIVDVFVDNKPRCNIWNGGRSVIGIQNNTGTQGITPPGRNTGSYNISSPEAWRFLPNGPSAYSTVEWFDQGASVGTGATVNVCPTVSNDYIARTTFTTCTGQQVVLEDTINVKFDVVDVTVAPLNAFICAGQSAILTAVSPQANDYVWNPGGLTGATVSVNPSSSTSYTVTATNTNNGCFAEATSAVALSTPQVNVCNVLYVTPTGSPTGTGSQSDPLDLSSAMNLGSCIGTIIKMAVGDYITDTTINRITSNLTLEGGFDPLNGWEKTSLAGATRILRTNANVTDPGGAAPRLIALEVNNQADFRFQDLTIEVQDAPAAAQGEFGVTCYGLAIESCSGYKIVRTRIIAGNGSDGGNGLDGLDGADGADGGDACGRNGASGGGNGGNGGNGGTDTGCSPCVFGNCLGPCDGSNGQAGGAGGGAGGGGGDRGVTCAAFGIFSGQHGGSGGNGSLGSNGGNGTAGAAPTYGQYFTPGAPGANGGNGIVGSGGGGAGGAGAATSTDGGGGGGGGGGGEGGFGGQGGLGGGGSFAIYASNNGAGTELIDIDLFNGNFGTGGTGGTGGIGGNGGTGGTSSENPCSGCQNFNNGGGNGGRGGNGGNGLSGQNGQASLLYVSGTSPQLLSNSVPQAIAQGSNNPTNFDLVAQPVITMDDIACTETDINFDSPASSAWTFDAGSTPPNANGQQVLTEYSTLGRKDIGYNSENYEGFVNVVLDAQTLPDFTTSAPLINGNYTICAGTTVSFTATNSGLNYNYIWDLDGGANPNTYNGLTFQTILATFDTAGVYDIQLQYETNCCGVSLPGVLTLVVEEIPDIVASADNQICLGNPGGVELNVSGNFANGDILWSPSTGLSSITADTVVALPTSTTSYVVTVSNASGLCQSSDTVVVSVTDLDLQATSTLSNCAVLGTIDLTVTGGSGNYSYAWDNGDITSDLNGLQAGDYEVVVTDNSFGCMDSLIVNVSAGPAALTAQETVTDESCADTNDGSILVEGNNGTPPYSFNWTNLGTTTTGVVSDSMTNLSPGPQEIIITDANGCIFTINTSIAAADSFLFIVDSLRNTTCLGLTDGYARIRVDGGVTPYTFSWSNNVPLVIENGDIVADNLAPGDYTLYIADSRVCTDSLLLEFTVDSVPTFFVDTTVCFGETYNVFGTDIVVGNDTVVNDTTYALSGCADEINILSINAASLPVATVTATPDTVFQFQSSILSATTGYTYDWSPESSSTSSTLEVIPLETTTYMVVVTDSLGCSEEYSVTVVMLNTDVELHIPDAFSPNNDGVNDIFRVVNPDFFEDIQMKVYNRWGELIHTSEGVTHGWDGYYKGDAQAIDVYTFTVKATSIFSGNKIKVSGNVSLIK